MPLEPVAAGRRRQRLLRRGAPVAVVAALAFGAGLVAGARHSPDSERLAAEYGRAWARGDWAAMHRLLTPAARARTGLRTFARVHRDAAEVATLARLDFGGARGVEDDAVELRMAARTRVWGALPGAVRLPVAHGDGAPGVEWAPHLVFPGLRPGERLGRTTALPPRATLLARDETVLARGDDRASELGPLAAEVVGRLGPPPPERGDELRARGVPADGLVGLTGLEREFDDRLRGEPGGELRAGGRVLARAAARPGRPVRTTIDPRVQRAAVEALAGRLGGVAAMVPATGEVLALAGVAYSAPQPPGSTFKVITLAAALERGKVSLDESFPVETAATLEGVEIQNAHGEPCGGPLTQAFAKSCNSVFAPLGVRVGARALVAAAERFGFNEEPSLAAAAQSTIPRPDEVGDDLAVGSTAIGQGKVLATALGMASVAAAIAADGRRVPPTLERGAHHRARRATPARVARPVGRLMRAVVTSGTGTGAALPGIPVAGKTGTAELRDTSTETPPTGEPVPTDDPTDTDAWFIGYAPAPRPRVAVAVLLVGQGAGGDTAAPAARGVLAAGARRR